MTGRGENPTARQTPGPAPWEHTTLRVATYNIHGAVGLDRRHDLDRVMDVINELEADIVGLQEVAVTEDADSVELIAEASGYAVVAGPNIVSPGCRFGNLLLSRWPVAEFRLLDLSIPSREPRGAIDARIEVRATTLQIVVTHLGLRRVERRRQLGMLRDAVNVDSRPSVILGDLNAPTRRELRRAGLDGRRALAPRSFPANAPIFALDRIWAYPDSMLRSVHAHRSRLSRVASDHLPVVADLVVSVDGGAEPDPIDSEALVYLAGR